jgi:hypothetical protein
MATYSNTNNNRSARDSDRDSELSLASRTSVHYDDDDGGYDYKNNNRSARDSDRASELLLASRTSVHDDDDDGGYDYKNNNRSAHDSDRASELLLASRTSVHDDAPSSESEEDDDDDDYIGYIAPSRKGMTVSPLGESIGSNDESYCPSEDSMDEDCNVPSGGLSSHAASDTAITPHHRQMNVDYEVYHNVVARATKERPRIVTTVEKSIILMMHGFFRFHAALTKPALFLQNSRASISNLIAHIVRRKTQLYPIHG